MKEKIMRAQAKAIKGFIREIVLMPEVLAAMISLFLTINIIRISMEIRDANGSNRLK
jgi:cell division protein FtsX